MSGLSLNLGPNERVLINGAVVENGNKPSRVHIMTPNVNILRLRDALHPEEANTPVRRVLYILQLILSGDADAKEAQLQVLRGLDQLDEVFKASQWRDILVKTRNHVTQDNFYQALRSLIPLKEHETQLLSRSARD